MRCQYLLRRTINIVRWSFLQSHSALVGAFRREPAIGQLPRQQQGMLMANLSVQFNDYRLTTAEILYHLPDHPALLQSFIWQNYDIAPRYPELRKFLDFWTHQIEGKLHSVILASRGIISAAEIGHAGMEFRLH
jgi:uncharacterized protein Usg